VADTACGEQSQLRPVVWGLGIGAILAAPPLAVWWLDRTTPGDWRYRRHPEPRRTAGGQGAPASRTLSAWLRKPAQAWTEAVNAPCQVWNQTWPV
jgi:hypothetical protein